MLSQNPDCGKSAVRLGRQVLHLRLRVTSRLRLYGLRVSLINTFDQKQVMSTFRTTG